MYCSPWHATWTASCFFLAESSEGDDPYFLASWDIFPSLGPNRAVAWVSFHLQRSLHRDHISFISAPHRDLFPANAMSRFSEEKDLKHATIGLEKKHRSQPPDFARSTEFVRQYWINTNLTLAANNPHALTFAPSLILLASLQILAQRLMISSLPCQKNCWAWQRSGKLSTESSTSAAGFLACLELLLTPLIAQLCKPVESNLYLRENFQHTQTIWERMPLRDPHFPDRKKYEYL